MAKDCYIYGFASRGEVCVPTKVESLCDFIDKFGEPENPIQEHLFRWGLGSKFNVWRGDYS